MKAILTFVAGLLFSAYAGATPVTLNYDGNISRISYATCQNFNISECCTNWNNSDITSTKFLYEETVGIGDLFSGTFTYDPESMLTGMSDDARSAVYLGGVLSGAIHAGELGLPASLAEAGIGNDLLVQNNGWMGFDSFYLSTWFSNTHYFASVHLDLLDSTGLVFHGFSIPNTLDFSAFNGSVFEIALLRQADGDQVHLYGDVTSLFSSVAVPEPGSLWSMVIGLLLISLTCRSRRTAFRSR